MTAAALSSGCSTYAKRVELTRLAYYSNDLPACRERLDDSPRGDRVCAQLDLAMVDLAAGEPTQAISRLREARDRLDHLQQSSAVESVAAMVADDRKRAWAGEDYERVMVRAMLAIASLISDGGDAESYSLQIDQTQRDYYERAVADLSAEQLQHYPVIPLGYYLRGALKEASFHDYGEAAENYAHVCELLPTTRPFAWDLERARRGVHSQRGNGVLYVFCLVGRGPRKVVATAEATSNAMLIADRIISAVGPYTLPPTIAPIQVPAIELCDQSVKSIAVGVDGRWIAQTDTIADIEQFAVDSMRLSHDRTLARAIARRAVKKATVVAAKNTMDVDPLVSLAMDAAGVAWEAVEAPDTRSWTLLPANVQVMRIELPAGRHQITLQPRTNYAAKAAQADVEIIDAHNTYMLGVFPDGELTGRLTVSQSGG